MSQAALTVALPKGRVLRAVAPLLVRAGADAAVLLEQGLAPTEDVAKEWSREERLRLQHSQNIMRRDEEIQINQGAGGAGLLFKTAAEPRPTAYIPDEIGIPKPYGLSAPFKPTELGSSMRHIRPPIIKPIEI